MPPPTHSQTLKFWHPRMGQFSDLFKLFLKNFNSDSSPRAEIRFFHINSTRRVCLQRLQNFADSYSSRSAVSGISKQHGICGQDANSAFAEFVPKAWLLNINLRCWSQNKDFGPKFGSFIWTRRDASIGTLLDPQTLIFDRKQGSIFSILFHQIFYIVLLNYFPQQYLKPTQLSECFMNPTRDPRHRFFQMLARIWPETTLRHA